MLKVQIDQQDDHPMVVTDVKKGRICVCAVNEPARRLGIRSGIELSAALALADELRINARSLPLEKAFLRSLAASFQSLTPKVCIEAPNVILLEVRDSLRLFGGLEKIKETVAERVSARALLFRLCIAPSAIGALWLSRYEQIEAHTFTELAKCVRSLPISVTGWPVGVQRSLKEMGVATVGDCLRLPRDGLAKRAGIGCLQDLDKVLGKAIELLAFESLPPTLTWNVCFPTPTSDSRIVLDAAGDVFGRLEAALRRQQKQLLKFTWRFHHLRREPSVETFELMEPDHDGQHMFTLFADRLERMEFPASIVAVEIETGVLQAMCLTEAELFPGKDDLEERAGVSHTLLERLRDRLGPKSVHGIELAEDHRPELAWRKRTEFGYAVNRDVPYELPKSSMRPLWLLVVPGRLASKGGRPVHHGPLRLQYGPERIESGWWGRRDDRRDYYTAVSSRGERLWIYLDRITGAWYLHGMFG